MERATLDAALASLAAQTYAKGEVIVVNAKGGQHRDFGGSVGCFALRIVNQGGVSLSRPQAANAGLDAAQGQYLAFLDDDDTLDPDHLSALVVALQAQSGVVVAYAGVRCIDRGDPEQKISRIFGAPLESFAQLLAGNFIPIHAPLFPRQLIKLARFDEGLETYEDWDFWLQLAQHAKFFYTGQVTATYYTGGSSGVSPQAPDWDAVRLALRALYAKWFRLAPDEFKKICDLYHRTAADLQSSREQTTQLDAQLAQTRTQLDSMQMRLQELLSSRSWVLTQPLRQLKKLAIKFLRSG